MSQVGRVGWSGSTRTRAVLQVAGLVERVDQQVGQAPSSSSHHAPEALVSCPPTSLPVRVY